MRFKTKTIERMIRLFPEKIPYTFQIQDFTFSIFVNTYSNDLYMICYDKDMNILGAGAEKLIQDFPINWIFSHDANGNFANNYPKFNLVPRSVDGKEYKITRENYGKWLLSYEEVV